MLTKLYTSNKSGCGPRQDNKQQEHSFFTARARCAMCSFPEATGYRAV
jgi:ribosomal protein L37E